MIYRPQINEYPSGTYIANYIERADGQEAINQLILQSAMIKNIFQNLSESGSFYRYEPEKWSLKEVLGHMSDTERILQYRILSIARGEKQALLPFDENDFVKNAKFDTSSIELLLKNYLIVRDSSISLLKSMDEEALDRIGILNKLSASTRAVCWFLVGHEHHHIKVLEKKYGIKINNTAI
ncbi:MAG: DinB family protein [Bacteroidota bacterium]